MLHHSRLHPQTILDTFCRQVSLHATPFLNLSAFRICPIADNIGPVHSGPIINSCCRGSMAGLDKPNVRSPNFQTISHCVSGSICSKYLWNNLRCIITSMSNFRCLFNTIDIFVDVLSWPAIMKCFNLLWELDQWNLWVLLETLQLWCCFLKLFSLDIGSVVYW